MGVHDHTQCKVYIDKMRSVDIFYIFNFIIHLMIPHANYFHTQNIDPNFIFR